MGPEGGGPRRCAGYSLRSWPSFSWDCCRSRVARAALRVANVVIVYRRNSRGPIPRVSRAVRVMEVMAGPVRPRLLMETWSASGRGSRGERMNGAVVAVIREPRTSGRTNSGASGPNVPVPLVTLNLRGVGRPVSNVISVRNMGMLSHDGSRTPFASRVTTAAAPSGFFAEKECMNARG